MEYQGTVTEVKEFRRDHPSEKNAMVTVRAVTLNLPSPEKYSTNRLQIESDTLQMNDQVRVLILPIPKLTSSEVEEVSRVIPTNESLPQAADPVEG